MFTSKKLATIFSNAVKANKYKEFLTHYTVEELQTFDIHTFYNHTMGYAITPKKEIANVFNNSLSIRHTGLAMVVDAIRHGGKTLFCFDGYPARLWKKIGFVETNRDAFDPMFAPEGWNYYWYGKPDVVCLVFWPATYQEA
jgi:hypothetical protein